MRRLVTVLAALCLLALPSAALAQSAGDEQYSDPFGDVEEPSGSQDQPAETPAAGRVRTCERFPVPDGDERREMWLRAAAEHFTDGMDLPRRTTV